MNRKTTTKTIIALLAAALAIAVALLLLLGPSGVMSPGDDASDDEDVEIVEEDSPEGDADEGEDSESGNVDGGEQDGGDADDGDADEDEDPDEKLVNAFDALVDSWMEPRDEGVSLADSDAFVAAFRKLPEERREECLQRALNLVPDDNVMLLVGILMDKSIDQELVELVFNDVLNRDEEVKKPILLEIFKDKSHPCWADTAWILDVTEGTPEEE